MSDFEIGETERGQRQDPQPVRNTITDLRGAARMVVGAITGITGLVEAMHANIAQQLLNTLGQEYHETDQKSDENRPTACASAQQLDVQAGSFGFLS